MLTPTHLRSYNRHDVTPHRSVRKTIFSPRLWRPRRQRVHSQRRWSVDPGRYPHAHGHAGGLTVGCINACSINNKGLVLCRTIIDKELDLLVITETWHEGPESAALKRYTPTGYKCVDAARAIPSDAAVHDVNFQNHGGLTIIHRDSVTVQKRILVSTASRRLSTSTPTRRPSSVGSCCFLSTDLAAKLCRCCSSTS